MYLRGLQRWVTRVMFKKMSEYFLVTPKEVKRFVTECMVGVGAAASHGEILADTLIAADSRGHYSHGLNRLGQLSVGGIKIKLSLACGQTLID